ncbi:hypothetical protein HPP92_018934 [Vanilla planifolia]|uniref:SURP motif domain-containing protein n=1 Tax=Vanilla planifolia TaxID=51239 RepID=A0A835QD02_VANPL|nr:hypothetical protein HPP92_018934 [Vanilla planifolia]
MLGPVLPLPAPPTDGDLGPTPPAQVIDESREEHTKPTPVAVPPPPSVATHTRTIGIIHPPPDIRTIIDKTANFVAKNGPDFERRIIANNAAQSLDFRIQNQTSQQPSDDTAQPGESTSMISSAAAPQQLSVEDAPGTRTEDPLLSFGFLHGRFLSHLKRNNILFAFLKVSPVRSWILLN